MRNSVLIAVILASFLTPFTLSSVNVALPTIGRDFEVDAITLNWIAISFLLTSAMFLVPFGKLADMRGRKKVFLSGMAVFTLGSLFSALSPNSSFLIAFRAFQGIGGAMIFATGIAILSSVFPAKERGKVLGINVASVYTGLSLGPFLGGILTENFGWRSVFLVTVPIGIVVIVFASFKIKGEWIDEENKSFDYIGSILYSSILAFFIVGISQLSSLMLLLCLCFAAILFLWESRIESPVFDFSLLKSNTTFTLSNLVALLSYTSTFAVGFLLSLYLQYVKMLSPQNAGAILLVQPAIQAVISPFAGWLSDRIEPKIVASAGMGLIALALLMFSGLESHTSIFSLLVYLALLGVGFALFSSPNTNAIMGSVDRRFYGFASATLSTMRVVGQMLSMAIVMFVFIIYIGRVLITKEVYHLLIKSIQISFEVFVVVCLLGIVISLARGGIR